VSNDEISERMKIYKIPDIRDLEHALRQGSRELINRYFYRYLIGLNPHWKKPKWLRKILEKGYPIHSSNIYNFLFRDWGVLGIPGKAVEAIICPDGEIEIWGRPCIELWVIKEGKLIKPGEVGEIQGIIDFKKIPTAKITWEYRNSLIKLEAKALTNGIDYFFVLDYLAENLDKVYLAIRFIGCTGFINVKKLRYDKTEKILYSDDQPYVIFKDPPLRWALTRYEDQCEASDIAQNTCETLSTNEIYSPSGLASAVFELNNKSGSIYILPESNRVIRVVNDVVNVWKKYTNAIAEIHIPDNDLKYLLRASVINLLSLVDDDFITPGPTIYHNPWVRDSAFMITALASIGLGNLAKDLTVKLFKLMQDKSGRFTALKVRGEDIDEWDSIGESIWLVAEAYRFTSDRVFLRQLYSRILKALDFADKIIIKKGDLKGLIERNRSFEDGGPIDVYFWDNFWLWRGYREGSFIANVMNDYETKEYLEERALEFRKILMDHIRKASDRAGRFFPSGPLRKIDSSVIRNGVSIWPLQFFKPGSKESINLLETIDSYIINGGAYHEMAWQSFGSYITMDLAISNALCGRWFVANEMLDFIKKTASPFGGWAEGISPLTWRGGFGDSPHGWAAANFIHMLKATVALDTDDGLIINMFRRWHSASILRIPIHFGEIAIKWNFSGDSGNIWINSNRNYKALILPPINAKFVAADKGEIINGNLILKNLKGKIQVNLESEGKK
jgi:flagellar biosynthesis regulator FlaF